MKKQHITLSEADRESLIALLKKGALGVKQYKRATALLELDRGKRLTEVAATLGVCYVTVSGWRDKYRGEGLAMLHDKPRSGRPIEIDGDQRAKITALACSERMGVGICACWPIKRWSWATARICRIPMRERY